MTFVLGGVDRFGKLGIATVAADVLGRAASSNVRCGHRLVQPQSITMDPDCCITALAEAMARFSRPEIFTTDQGSQSPALPSPTP